MKDHTRITMVQITEVVKDEQEAVDFVMREDAKEVYTGTLADTLKNLLRVDDVVVTSVQDFVTDAEEKPCV